MEIIRSLVPDDMGHRFVSIRGVTHIAGFDFRDHRLLTGDLYPKNRMRKKDDHRIRGVDMHRRGIMQRYMAVQHADIGIL